MKYRRNGKTSMQLWPMRVACKPKPWKSLVKDKILRNPKIKTNEDINLKGIV
jgi:hypothetical protein